MLTGCAHRFDCGDNWYHHDSSHTESWPHLILHKRQQSSMNRQPPPLDRLSPPEAKIALFRSLFRGREDVYARRFENLRTGKTGYAPACGNEWSRH